MRFLIGLMSFMMVILMSSCGGKGEGEGKGKEEADSSADKNSITLKTELQGLGDLTNYASFPDEIKIKKTSEEGDNVEFVLSLAFDVKTAVCSDYSFSFKTEIADEDHIVIKKLLGIIFANDEVDLNTDSDLDNYMNVGISRKEEKFRVTKEEWENILENGKYIVIKNDISDAKFEAYHSDSRKSAMSGGYSNDDGDEAVDDDSSSSGAEDWDSVLDSYERYVDKYIAMMKKAQAGDASALAEYPSLMEEAEEYGNKLQNATGSLSSSQIARYQSINNKMIQAAK